MNLSARVLRMSDRARAGNNRRCAKWRSNHRKKYNAYMREYRARKRGDTARVLLA